MKWGHPHRAKVLLFAVDTFLTVSVGVILLWTSNTASATPPQFMAEAVFVVAFLASFYVFDLYNLEALESTRTIYRLVAACSATSLFLAAFFSLFPWLSNRSDTLISSGLILLVVIYTWRRVYGHIAHLFSARESILVIGTPEEADIVRDVVSATNSRYDLVGFLQQQRDLRMLGGNTGSVSHELIKNAVTPAPARAFSVYTSAATAAPARVISVANVETEPASISAKTPCLGWATAACLNGAVTEHSVRALVVRNDAVDPELASALTRLRFAGIHVFPLPEFHMRLSEELQLGFLSDSWLSFANGFDVLQARLFRKVKRLTDLFLAAVGLILSFPILLLAALAIKLDSRGPVMLRQRRVGWMGQPFEVLKLRSMREDAERDGRPQWATLDDPRVTRVGRILRKFRLDELPQLVNVLHGEMSFVGPRPERPLFVEQLTSVIPFYHLRHYVPPGITGWAQVKYPYGASIEDARRKLQFDLYYICNASPLLDLRILLRTARVVLFRRGSR